MLRFLILFHILRSIAKVLYVYDTAPVAELDTEKVGEVQFYLTKDEGSYMSALNPNTGCWSSPTPLAGMNTYDYKPLNTAGGSEQFGMKGVEINGPGLPSPYAMGDGEKPELLILGETQTKEAEKASDSKSGKDCEKEKPEKKASKGKSKKAKNSASSFSLLPLIVLTVLTSSLL
jgi:hypothetical protein